MLTNYKKQLNAVRSLNLSEDNSKKLHSVLELKQGSFFIYEKELYLVEEVGIYNEKGFKWNELECYNINKDQRVYFEVEKDDEIEMSITLKEIKLNQINKTPDQIEEISDNEEGSLIYNGKLTDRTFEYEDDYGAKWSRNGESYKVYFYDFVNRAGEYVTLEEWEIGQNEYEYKAYLSKEIFHENITIVKI